jgi:hypothetical protein
LLGFVDLSAHNRGGDERSTNPTIEQIFIITIAQLKKIWQSLRGLVITSSTSGIFQAYSQAA